MARKKKVEEACEKCGGSGWLPASMDEEVARERKEQWGPHADAYIYKQRCECLWERQFQRFVGKAIYNAKPLKESPLTGREDEDLFIEMSRHEVLSHLRTVMVQKPRTYFFRLTTDLDLKEIFVGNHPEYNSVPSYVANPDLVIIQLAVLSYKNVAMAGVVLEALKTRNLLDKPTWVINPDDTSWSEGHLAWSPELDWFLSENFETVRIKRLSPGKVQPNPKGRRDMKINPNDVF